MRNDINQNIEVGACVSSRKHDPASTCVHTATASSSSVELTQPLPPADRRVRFICLQRLRARQVQDPQQFAVLFNIIDEEVSRNDHNHSKSCTKGLLWLKRWVAWVAAAWHAVRVGRFKQQQQLELQVGAARAPGCQDAVRSPLVWWPIAGPPRAHAESPPTHVYCQHPPTHTGPLSS